MEMKVLGTGCARCKDLYKEAEKAVRDSGEEIVLTKVEDIEKIMAYGVMSTPALVLGGKILCSGKTPRSAEIVTMIKNQLAGQ
jgi:small redox-active disulfide protein 2